MSRHSLTLADVLERLAVRDHQRRRRNAARVRRVAAGLPALELASREGRPDNSEAAAPARATAS